MSTSQKAIRYLDWFAMIALAAVVIYKFVLPHPSASLPAAGTHVTETHGKPVLVDLSSTR
jgi:hypothetical protein